MNILKVLVVCGLHGNEPSSLLLAKELMHRDTGSSIEIELIPFGNREAFFVDQREINGYDWNRCFVRDKVHSQVKWIAQKVAQADIVLDIHNDATCIVPISVLVPESKIQNRTVIHLINSLFPGILVPIPDNKLSGTLCQYAFSLGKSALIIELPPPEAVTNNNILSILRGIDRFIATSSRDNSHVNVMVPVIINEKRIKCSVTGLFRPAIKKVPTLVKKGTLLGTLVSPELTNMTDSIRARDDSWIFAIGRSKIHQKGATIVRFLTA